MPRNLVTVGLVAAALLAGCSRNAADLRQQHLEAGARFVERQEFDKAIIEYLNALKQDQSSGETHFALAEAYMADGNTRAAMPAYVRAADLLPEDDAAQLKAGQLLFKGGMFEEARTRARNVLQRDPNNIEALLLLGNALAGLQDLDNAVSVVERAGQLDPERAGIYSNLAVLQLAKGDQSQAQEAFEKALEVSGESIPSLVALGNFYRVTNRLADAERLLRRAYEADPNHVAVNEALAALYMTLGRPAAAEQHLKAVASLVPEPNSIFALASYYVSMGRYEEAVANLETIADHPQRGVDANIRLAMIEYATGDGDAALQRINAVIKQNRDHGAALTMKARLLLAENQPEEALEEVQMALRAQPRLGEAHLTLGRIYKALGKNEEARRALTQTLEVQPGSLPAMLELVELHRARQDFDSARHFADLAVNKYPNSLPARLALVRLLLVRGEPGADDQVRLLMAQHPDAAPAHAVSGAEALSRSDITTARRSFERALQMNPDSFEALSGLLALDLANGQTTRALARLDATMARRDRDIETYYLAAGVYEFLGETAKVEETLKKAIELEPSNPETYGRLGELFASQNRMADARREFEQVVTLQPRAVGAMSILGVLAYAEGNTAEAKRWWEAALKADPNAAAAANNLAALLADTGGDLNRAMQLAESARRQFPTNPDIEDTVGWIHYRRGFSAIAIGFLERAVQKRPDNPMFQYHLGMTYAARGDDAKARAALELALKLSPAFEGAAEARQTLRRLVY